MTKKEFRKLIQEKTGCTKEQAKMLRKEMNKLPKVRQTFINNLDTINLYNADRIEVVRVCGYMDDNVNVVAYRKDPRFKCADINTLYKYCLTPDKMYYEII